MGRWAREGRGFSIFQRMNKPSECGHTWTFTEINCNPFCKRQAKTPENFHLAHCWSLLPTENGKKKNKKKPKKQANNNYKQITLVVFSFKLSAVKLSAVIPAFESHSHVWYSASETFWGFSEHGTAGSTCRVGQLCIWHNDASSFCHMIDISAVLASSARDDQHGHTWPLMGHACQWTQIPEDDQVQQGELWQGRHGRYPCGWQADPEGCLLQHLCSCTGARPAARWGQDSKRIMATTISCIEWLSCTFQCSGLCDPHHPLCFCNIGSWRAEEWWLALIQSSTIALQSEVGALPPHSRQRWRCCCRSIEQL